MPRGQGGVGVEEQDAVVGECSGMYLEGALPLFVLSEHVGAAGEKRRIHAEARV
ncbi:MAG: hypothetical protein WA484_11715 [Solirubrobacteraceae bacterium]